MNLYQMKSNPNGIEHISKFLEDNFVSIGLQGIGDLEINLFVHTMQDGDYVLVVDQDYVHLGDLGDYFYDELSDTVVNGLCHRRGVTWLTRIPLVEMNSEVQELLAQTEMISQFKYPLARAQLNQWSSNLLGSERVTAKSVQLDEETIAEAIEILKKALHSDDEERRERAAIAILQYVKL